MVQKWDNQELDILANLRYGEFHIRALEKLIKIPHSTLIRKLARLEKQNIIDFKFIGKNKQYFIKNNLKSKKMLEMMENYRLINFLDKYPVLEPLFDDIINNSNNMTILFGSYAKYIPKKESDIDIYIETNDKNIKDKIERLNSRISVKIGVFDKKSLLIKEIIKNHIILKGVERFYEHIFGEIEI